MESPRFIAWRSSDWLQLVFVAVLVAVLASLITLLYVVFSVIRVEGESMAPALEPGDRVLITRGYGVPRAGDIVCFVAEEGGHSSRVVKRVIGVPGDTIQTVGDNAYVNGVISNVAPGAVVSDDIHRLGPLVVPEGSVYVLGDNRPISLDSRFTGPVPLSAVLGRGVAVILPLHHFRMIDE